LGDPPYGLSLNPVQVSLPANIRAITTTYQNAYALDADGSVWAWGNCNWGALGNDSNPCSDPASDDAKTPVKVGALDGIRIVAIASANTSNTMYALGEDGKIRAWGFGYEGQLGNGLSGYGSNGQYYYSGQPVIVSNPDGQGSLDNVVSIGAGSGNGYAVRRDGTAWAWGSGYSGLLGNGTVDTNSALPVKISGLTYPRKITGGLAAYAIVGGPIVNPFATYAALGDSYSSGEGAPNPGYLAGTDMDGNFCHRSTAAYPNPVHDATSAVYPNFVFRACSGVKIRDFFQANKVYVNEPPQLSWLDDDTELVTLSIGGNDVGFAEVMKYCATRRLDDPSCQAKFGKAVDRDLAEIASTNPKDKNTLLSLYRAIRLAAPHARVLVLGYPRLFPLSPPARCETGVPARFFEQFDMVWLNGVATSLDQAVREIAESVGFTYVDLYAAFSDHELCTADPYLNRAIFFPKKSIVNWSFHPNVNGQSRFAALVQAWL